MKHDEADSSTSAHPELPAETSDQSVVDVDVVVAAAAVVVAVAGLGFVVAVVVAVAAERTYVIAFVYELLDSSWPYYAFHSRPFQHS